MSLHAKGNFVAISMDDSAHVSISTRSLDIAHLLRIFGLIGKQH